MVLTIVYLRFYNRNAIWALFVNIKNKNGDEAAHTDLWVLCTVNWLLFGQYCVINSHWLILAYRPGYQCAASENRSHTNTSIYTVYEKCQIKTFHNHTNSLQLMSVVGCSNGYQYTFPKENTIVTEVTIDECIII